MTQEIAKQLGDYEITCKHIPSNWDGKRANFDSGNGVICWEVIISYKGREVYRGAYKQGMGYLPYTVDKTFGQRLTIAKLEAIQELLGKGIIRIRKGINSVTIMLVPPSLTDVLSSLLQDGNAIDYRNYEEWANDTGFDSDSRKGEKIYHDCLTIGLSFRSVCGETELARLRELFSNY